MGNIRHLEILKAGKDEWNNWRTLNPAERPDFSSFNLDRLDLEGYNLGSSDFSEANLRDCNLNNSMLTWCIFIRTQLNNTTIINPSLDEYSGNRRLLGVNLRWSSFAEANLQNVKMTGATLEAAQFHKCNLKGTDISDSEVFGISAWGNVFDDSSKQTNLIITEGNQPVITIDDLEMAQFLYMLVNNSKMRNAIDTLATKVVLILGSFSNEDKPILDSIKSGLSISNFIPVMYDFDKPTSRNHTETVSTIAHLSKFIIADLTNQRSIPHELAILIPNLRSVPVIPLIRDEQKPYGMFQDFENAPNVASIINYLSASPINDLIEEIKATANLKIIELHKRT